MAHIYHLCITHPFPNGQRERKEAGRGNAFDMNERNALLFMTCFPSPPLAQKKSLTRKPYKRVKCKYTRKKAERI